MAGGEGGGVGEDTRKNAEDKGISCDVRAGDIAVGGGAAFRERGFWPGAMNPGVLPRHDRNAGEGLRGWTVNCTVPLRETRSTGDTVK